MDFLQPQFSFTSYIFWLFRTSPCSANTLLLTSLICLVISSQLIAIAVLIATELRHYYSGHIYANPSQRATKLYYSIAVLILTTQLLCRAMRNLSLLCLCKLLYANQCRSVTTQCISYPIYAFALPIITTFIHAVAYSVISVHVYRPFPELRHWPIPLYLP